MKVISLFFATVLCACAARTRAPHGGGSELPDPGPIRPPDAIPYEFQWHQRVTAEWPEGKQAFEAVLQRRGDELLLVGLSPMGVPGFVLTLRADGGIAFENRTDTELPFPPAFILADVERVFFPWLDPVPADFSGEREGERLGLKIRERFVAGRLVERTFEQVGAAERGVVRVVYEGASATADAPPRVILTNGWFDYRLTIETLAQSRL